MVVNGNPELLQASFCAYQGKKDTDLNQIEVKWENGDRIFIFCHFKSCEPRIPDESQHYKLEQNHCNDVHVIYFMTKWGKVCIPCSIARDIIEAKMKIRKRYNLYSKQMIWC